jgi:DNA-binding transcriptional regulator LsrR (DeoR family)
VATHDYHALLVAYFHGQDNNLKQEALAERLGLSGQAQVSKLLKQARQMGYLREVFEFPQDVSPDTRRKIENSYFDKHSALEAELIRRAQIARDKNSDGSSPFKRLHVCAAPGLEIKDGGARERAFSTFGANAAEIVASYIDNADTCCVAWGRTLHATVRHVRPRTTPGSKKIFMPITGEPTNYEPNGISPSDAAQMLAAAWPGSEYLSLRGVQARIPKSVYERGNESIARELALDSDNYRRIFGHPGNQNRPLMSQVAMIFTGIGDAQTSGRASGVTHQEDPWWLETAKAEGRDVLSLATGNIGGIWIPSQNASAVERDNIEKMNARWLGAEHGHFERCSLLGGTADRPGVVVVAVEPEKAEIILEALYLMNVLIISRHLADALAKELKV